MRVESEFTPVSDNRRACTSNNILLKLALLGGGELQKQSCSPKTLILLEGEERVWGRQTCEYMMV